MISYRLRTAVRDRIYLLQPGYTQKGEERRTLGKNQDSRLGSDDTMSSVVMSDAAARLHQLELQAALERDEVNQRTNDEILHLKTTFQSNLIRLNLIRCNISEDDYSRMVADLKSRCSKDLEKIQRKRRYEQKVIDLQLNFQLTML